MSSSEPSRPGGTPTNRSSSPTQAAVAEFRFQPDDITIADIVKEFGPTSSWYGECMQVCVELVGLVNSDFMPGELVCGTWTGSDPPKRGYWLSHSLKEDRWHAWIKLPDGRIFDPTRWCLEEVEPYIWIGNNDGCYEEDDE